MMKTMKSIFAALLASAAVLAGQEAGATDQTKVFTNNKMVDAGNNQVSYEGNIFLGAMGGATLYKGGGIITMYGVQQEATIRLYPRISGKVKSIVFSSAQTGSGSGYVKIGKGSEWTNSISENMTDRASVSFTSATGITLENENDYLEIKLYDGPEGMGLMYSDGSITITYEPTLSSLTHTHNFSYVRSGSTLTATCAHDDGLACNLASGNWQISTTLTPPSTFLYAKDVYHPATLSNLAGFMLETGASATDITYMNETTGENIGTNDPNAPGDYTATATITVGGTNYTLTTSFSIKTNIKINCIYPRFRFDNERYTDASMALAGETVTLTYTPIPVETLQTLTVTGNTSGDEIPLTQTDTYVYTFTMPAEEVTVNAEFSVALVLHAAKVLGEDKYVTTFYDGLFNYQLPEGAVAYTASLVDGNVVFYRVGENGNILPRGTAVIVVADTSSVGLTKLDSNPGVLPHSGNILQGSDTDIATPVGTVYVLGKDDNGVMTFLTFNGTTIPAGKAYYVAE